MLPSYACVTSESQTKSDIDKQNQIESDIVRQQVRMSGMGRVAQSQTESDIAKQSQTETDRVRHSQT